MSFIRFLQGIGDRLGVLESVAGPDNAPARRIQTRVVSLRELATEIRSGEVRVLADSPAELAIPFDEIFRAAGISEQPKDWTIAKLQQVIATEAAKQKSREAVQRSILDLLKAEGVPPEMVIKDAIARDQALDAFESRVSERMQERNQACKRRMLEIQEQVKDLETEKARIEASLEADEKKWREWRRQKRLHERELASAASYIVDRPVVTTDDDE
jgi:hypothetical protein